MWTTRTRVGLWLWRCISLARSRLCLYLPEPGCHQRKLWKGKYSFCLWCSGSYPVFCVFQASYQFIEYIPGQYATFQRLVFSDHPPKSSHERRWLPGSTCLHDTYLLCLYLFLRSLENWLSPVLLSPVLYASTCLEIYTLLLMVTPAF